MIMILSLLAGIAQAAPEKTTAQKVDAELTQGAQQVGAFFHNNKKKKKGKKSLPDSINEAGEEVKGAVGDLLGTQQKKD